MNEALDKYKEFFGEPFPLMLVMGMDEKEVIEIINKCIKSGDAYDPDIEKDTVV